MNVHRIKNPVLIDAVIDQIQVSFADKLKWLDNIYPRAVKVAQKRENVTHIKPCVYKSGNDYEDVSPNDKLGNFCFFLRSEPDNVKWEQYQDSEMLIPFSIIFWVDARKVTHDRNTERIKADILHALRDTTLAKGRVTVLKIYEEAENVYRGFTLDETNNQFMIHPYCGFRFEGEIKAIPPCGIGYLK